MTEARENRGKSGTLVGRLRRSLSAKLLLLSIGCVLAAESFLLIPAVARQRLAWLSSRIENAYLVGLALESPEAEMISTTEADRLFRTADILGVMIDREGANILVSAPQVDFSNPPEMHYIDLTQSNAANMVSDATASLFSSGDNWLRVVGEPAYAPGERVDIIISQAALRRDLWASARNILWLSLLILLFAGSLLYWALNQIIVRPVARLTRNMTAFQENPEDEARLIAPSARADEIGVAERGLHELETRIQGLLSQRRRLAALGAGVSKITHDLRNILASAQLMSDRLAKSEDPRVRKLAPRLIQSLDRAIALSRDALVYARMEPSALSKSEFALKALIEEVFEDAAAMHVDFRNEVPETLRVVADRHQLYRAIFNLVRNAVDALAPEEPQEGEAPHAPARRGDILVRASPARHVIRIEIVDNGPGVPEAARETMFEPFKGSTKSGGSGLGLAIAHEIMKAHQGDLKLSRTGADGAAFELLLPDQA